MIEFKKELQKVCLAKVKDRIGELKSELQSLKESAEADTKSSMGDKYETSREMINLEKGKIASQLGEAVEMHTVLNSYDLEGKVKKIGMGSLVVTDIAKFYISVALGPVDVQEEKVFVISPGSPLAQQLADKSKGDQIQVGSALHKIQFIV